MDCYHEENVIRDASGNSTGLVAYLHSLSGLRKRSSVICRTLVGYGLEGALPDATASMIVNREMVPHFQQGDIYGGVKAAVDIILPIIAGEYSSQEYEESGEGGLGAAVIVIVVFCLILYCAW